MLRFLDISANGPLSARDTKPDYDSYDASFVIADDQVEFEISPLKPKTKAVITKRSNPKKSIVLSDDDQEIVNQSHLIINDSRRQTTSRKNIRELLSKRKTGGYISSDDDQNDNLILYNQDSDVQLDAYQYDNFVVPDDFTDSQENPNTENILLDDDLNSIEDQMINLSLFYNSNIKKDHQTIVISSESEKENSNSPQFIPVRKNLRRKKLSKAVLSPEDISIQRTTISNSPTAFILEDKDQTYFTGSRSKKMFILSPASSTTSSSSNANSLLFKSSQNAQVLSKGSPSTNTVIELSDDSLKIAQSININPKIPKQLIDLCEDSFEKSIEMQNFLQTYSNPIHSPRSKCQRSTKPNHNEINHPIVFDTQFETNDSQEEVVYETQVERRFSLSPGVVSNLREEYVSDDGGTPDDEQLESSQMAVVGKNPVKMLFSLPDDFDEDDSLDEYERNLKVDEKTSSGSQSVNDIAHLFENIIIDNEKEIKPANTISTWVDTSKPVRNVENFDDFVDKETPRKDCFEISDDSDEESGVLVYEGSNFKPSPLQAPLADWLQKNPTRKHFNTPSKIPIPLSKQLGIKSIKKPNRDALSRKFYTEFNQAIFEDKLPANLEIKWSVNLNTTAGRAHTIKKTLGKIETFSAWIELSTKVLDSEDKLRSTLAHEMCHVASWLINRSNTPPHGTVFKYWGQKVTRVYPDMEVNTCHSYDINYKYWYVCVNEKCGKRYGRHSKSINTSKLGCGCGSLLELEVKLKLDGTPVKESAFSIFLKENFKRIKQSNSLASHKEVMQICSAEYKKDQLKNKK